MFIPRTLSFLENDQEEIEERFESLLYRLYFMKENLRNKRKLLHMTKCSLRTYIRVQYLLGEPL